MSKDDIRAALFSTTQFKVKSFNFFGTTIEMRQPSLGQILKISQLNKNEDKLAIAQILIDYAYVPGTEEKVFTAADYESIVNLPSGKWVSDLFELWGDLAGGDGATAEKN